MIHPPQRTQLKRRRRLAAPIKQYRAIECTACEEIVMLQWTQQPVNLRFARHRQPTQLSCCPLCNSQQLVERSLSANQYRRYSHDWDLLELGASDAQAEPEHDNVIDISSLFSSSE